MNTVFILGAGASKDSGAPVVNEFLEKARSIYALQQAGVDLSAFADVFQAVSELRTIHDKSYLDLDNIEHLFAAIDTGLLIGKFSNRTADQIKDLRVSIIKLITRTLTQTVRFPVAKHRIRASQTYHDFLRTLNSLVQSQNRADPYRFAFITFNYDIVLDLSLSVYGYRYDYCLKDGNVNEAWPLLKLHGSVSWTSCTKCQNTIVPLDLGQLRPNPLLEDGDSIIVDTTEHLPRLKCKECGQPVDGEPILVPPTWNKTQYQSHLANVWRRAAQELGKAQNIIVIGYSMPDTDAFFRYLYALGSDSTVKLRKFIVVNPDASIEARYKEILGPGILKQFAFWPVTFPSSISKIYELLRQ